MSVEDVQRRYNEIRMDYSTLSHGHQPGKSGRDEYNEAPIAQQWQEAEAVRQQRIEQEQEQQLQDRVSCGIVVACLTVVILAIATRNNKKIERVVFQKMFRYISIISTLFFIGFIVYKIVTPSSYRHGALPSLPYVLAVIFFAIINLLALIKLPPDSLIFDILRRKRLENEIKTLEAKKRIEELQERR